MSEFTMESYQASALDTRSPTTPELEERLKLACASIIENLKHAKYVGNQADELKREVYYNKYMKACHQSHISNENMLQRLVNVVDEVHAYLGIASECNEIAAVLIDYIENGTAINNLNAKEEAGDFLWYINLWLSACGSNIVEAAAMNIAKLKARYPSKFSESSAVNRDVANEQAAMSQT